ncbi:hypothetical protein Tco_1530674 [Tanacetum coccineum]
MVLNSPCFTVKSWLVQDQTVPGKDKSNLLIADSLLKTIWLSMHYFVWNYPYWLQPLNRLERSILNWDLQPRKRFRDSYLPEDSEEEHIEVDTADAEAVADVGISEGVVAHPKDGVGMGFEIAASDVREDDEEFEAEASAEDTREIAVDPLAISDSSESSRGAQSTSWMLVHLVLVERDKLRIERIRSILLEST